MRNASPEQLREQPVFTAASDVFSLGTTVARLALGRRPWGEDTATVVANIRAGAAQASPPRPFTPAQMARMSDKEWQAFQEDFNGVKQGG